MQLYHKTTVCKYDIKMYKKIIGSFFFHKQKKSYIPFGCFDEKKNYLQYSYIKHAFFYKINNVLQAHKFDLCAVNSIVFEI